MGMKTIERPQENRENPKDYELMISVTRHGPKADMHAEDLSPAGRQDVADRFYDAYEGVSIDNRDRTKIVSSSIKRVVQTVGIAEHSLQQYNEAAPMQVELDERITEQGVNAFIKQLPEDQRKNWFQYWYESEEGHAATVNFKNWLIEQINNAKSTGGKIEVDAYSHGPVMGAFLIRLEDKLGLKFLARGKEDPLRLNRDKLVGEGGDLAVLSNFNVTVSSKNPEVIKIFFHGQTHEVSLKDLGNL